MKTTNKLARLISATEIEFAPTAEEIAANYAIDKSRFGLS